MGVFSMKGRYNRAKFFGTVAAIWVAFSAIGLAVGVAMSLLLADDLESVEAAAGPIGGLLAFMT